ncbi:nucleotidyl transferase AbiEii/AbiGii toxin family protein [Hymenobacter antarcticus]|uniref:Nucleotidyl transferase AbiEii toxin, Type IV TA system n=1 Tax=Hymenobacter antarcticus TaxID=486270 RepID=A0ABP7Q4N9_9BACT
MLPEPRNLPRLMAIARALGPLRERVVFVGGAIVNLYSTSATRTPEPRITDDVDCIVEVAPRTAFYALEEELRALGFANDVASGVICRWQFQGLTVDVMPTEPEILGFSNPWYPAGFTRAIAYALPDATAIRILSPVYFVATKLVALRDRGWDELRMSQDLEDLVHVVDNRSELTAEIAAASADVRADIQQRLAELLTHPDFLEAVEWTLPYGSGYERKVEIARRLEQIRAGWGP